MILLHPLYPADTLSHSWWSLAAYQKVDIYERNGRGLAILFSVSVTSSILALSNSIHPSSSLYVPVCPAPSPHWNLTPEPGVSRYQQYIDENWATHLQRPLPSSQPYLWTRWSFHQPANELGSKSRSLELPSLTTGSKNPPLPWAPYFAIGWVQWRTKGSQRRTARESKRNMSRDFCNGNCTLDIPNMLFTISTCWSCCTSGEQPHSRHLLGHSNQRPLSKPVSWPSQMQSVQHSNIKTYSNILIPIISNRSDYQGCMCQYLPSQTGLDAPEFRSILQAKTESQSTVAFAPAASALTARDLTSDRRKSHNS